MSQKLFTFIFIVFSFFFASFAYAENIDPADAGNDFAVLEFDDSQISFDCTSCNVEVTDSEITGYAWGENVGWINLQPGSSGVLNDGDGNLSGYAWGENTGWVNFDPTFGGVSIVDGFFDGYAWSENYGWIQFDCGISGACVETGWQPTSEEPGGGGGGGSSPSPYVGCTNIYAINYNPQASIDNGTCIFDGVILGCMVPSAINYNPQAVVEDNSCQFGDIETPDDPEEFPEDVDEEQDEEIVTNPIDIETPDDPEEFPEDVDYVGDISQGNETATPLGEYSFSKIDVETASKIIPTLALILSLLSIPLRQLLQIPTRAFQTLFSWFAIGSKKTWGVVFDSITKQALDPVVVSLIDSQGVVRKTSITDMEGRYGFIAEPGLYRLEARKADYLFPSQKLYGKNSDNLYDDLYFGGTFQILEQGEIVTKNIPLDPIGFNWNEYEKARLGINSHKNFLRRLQKYSQAIFIFGFVLSIIAVLVFPIVWNYIVLAVYVFLGTLQFLGLPKKPGSVYTYAGKPLSFGVMRVYSQNLAKEIKKIVLDADGKYYCLIRSGKYYVTFESRKEDGTYELVHTTNSFKVRNGIIRKKFII